MTKIEVAKAVSEKTGLDIEKSQEAVNAFMDTVKDALECDEPVYLRGFGTFINKHRAAKVARNISKGTKVNIPAKKVPFFKPCKELKESVI